MKFIFDNDVKLVIRVFNDDNEILEQGFCSEEESCEYTTLLEFLHAKYEEWMRDTDGRWIEIWEA